MYIGLENQYGLGRFGDYVQSNLGSRGKRHFVTPVRGTYGMDVYEALGRKEPHAIFAPDVALEANDFGKNNFAAKYTWEGKVTVDPRRPHVAKVSRNNPGHFPVKIKNKAGKVEAELDVWVVGLGKPSIEPREGRDVGDDGESFVVAKGFTFIHMILPANITSGPDWPDLKRYDPTTHSAPVGAGLDYQGRTLKGGVNAQWDCSRIVRQRVLNPSGVPLPGAPAMNADYLKFPTMDDGDGRPEGSLGMFFEQWMVAGNDDSGTTDEDNDPYAKRWGAHHLMSQDLVNAGLEHRHGKNGDTVEWRIHFQEFVRLEINHQWYRIGDAIPWRVHYKLKKVNGKWQDNGSEAKLNNDGF